MNAFNRLALVISLASIFPLNAYAADTKVTLKWCTGGRQVAKPKQSMC